jgi:hypothetical protein
MFFYTLLKLGGDDAYNTKRSITSEAYEEPGAG